MSDQRENRTTWEEILSQAQTPPLPASWKAMEGLLDQEMPVRRGGRGWRWMLLLLLLLLIGVCRLYRGGGRRGDPPAVATSAAAGTARVPTARTPSAEAPFLAAPEDGYTQHAGRTPEVVVTPETEGAGSVSSAPGAGEASGRGLDERAFGAPNADKQPPGAWTFGARQTKNAHDKPTGETAGIVGEDTAAGEQPVSGQPAGEPATDTAATASDVTKKQQTSFTRSPSTIAPAPAPQKPAQQKPAPQKLAPPKNKKPPPVPDGPYKGITAGIGLNQFFPVGQQVNAHFNAEGTNGTITDYLPVPVLRYFFSRKLYVQVEAQFNTPQYTGKNVLASETVDSSNLGGATANSVYIRKLFYFNLPVSIYYSPIKHLYAGVGLEYARLTNGVADFQASQSYGTNGQHDSILYTKIQTFKGDSIYQKLRTHEWRLTGDLNYQWEGFTLGVRYNWSLNKFINVHVSSTQVTQSRNSSLQVYLRYTLWRQKSLRKLKK
ncbi:porin family protein [Dinghuibacter silviterrae]|uniref:Outer membrane protein with beta-barrel domain n=1 Tax=Dinghuibacter silviterrae TaxID=1539049 RepID=A0A4R8DHA2_9BACT|nr:hypothetical protein [Dinghuibacter silviterrae]TDW96486.1 hypothetical protein EDB95_4317 [Dinghuibacter silviterrae]